MNNEAAATVAGSGTGAACDAWMMCASCAAASVLRGWRRGFGGSIGLWSGAAAAGCAAAAASARGTRCLLLLGLLNAGFLLLLSAAPPVRISNCMMQDTSWKRLSPEL